MKVKCYGHIDPAKGYYHDAYTVAHEFTEAQAVMLLELFSLEDWEDGPHCLAQIADMYEPDEEN